jgi:tetrahydromethanopterin S-methyltransferase subunit G
MIPATNSFWHRLLVRRRGRRDGRAGIPALNDPEPSEYEKQLVSRGAQHMTQVVAAYAPKIRKLQAQLEAMIERLKDLTSRFTDVMGRYNRRRQELGRDVIVHFVSKRAYRIIMVCIALGEFALNAQAFEVFQKPLFMTILMAASVGIGIPWLAHLCGIWIKQWPKPTLRTAIKLAICVLGTVGGLLAINTARIAHLEQAGLASASEARALQGAFLGINLLVFLAATFLSYAAHEQDQELDNLYEKVKELGRKIKAVESEISNLEGHLKGLRDRQRTDLDLIKHITMELIHLYRTENHLARKDGAKPKSFETEPQIPEPSPVGDNYFRTLGDQIEHLRKMRREAQTAEIGAPAASSPSEDSSERR